MQTTKSTPYSHLDTDALLAEMTMLEDEIKQNSEHLDWAKEHDHDSGLIDALDEGLRHACADYGWMQQEMWNRGWIYNNMKSSWELRS